MDRSEQSGLNPGSASPVERLGSRLDSWKEIACYLGRSEKTVRRWEEREELPVHRLLHEKRGSVYAYARELDGWREARKAAIELRAKSNEKEPQGLDMPRPEVKGYGFGRVRDPHTSATLSAAAPANLSTHRAIPDALWRRSVWLLFPRRLIITLAGLSVLLISTGAAWFAWQWKNNVQGGIGDGGIRSLVVLPLENLSGDKGQDYLADGVTEALITELGRIGGLRVISMTSVMRYKGTHQTLPEIGSELNTQAMVEGAVERSEDRVRVTAKLIRTATQEQLWENSFDCDLHDILGLQSALAHSIASEIRIKISPHQDARMRIPARAPKARAVDLYLQGLAKLRAASNKEGHYEAIAFFEKALTADPKYALGYAGLAEAYSRLGFRHLVPTDSVKWKAEEAVRRALDTDPNMGQAYLLAGQIAAEFEWNSSDAERFLRKALELEPGNPEFHRSFAQYVSMYDGRMDEALFHFKQAESLDPFTVYLTTEVGRCYYQFRRYEDAITKLREATKRAPDYVDAHFFLGLAYLGLEEYQPATAELEKAVKLAGRAPAELAYFSHAIGRSGDRARATILHAELMGLAKKTYVPDHYLAISLIGLGRVDEAIEHLRKALNDQTISGKFSQAPIYDSIRDYPGFLALAQQFQPNSPRLN